MDRPVDGTKHQIDRIRSDTAAGPISVTIMIGLISVIEYLWGLVVPR